MAQYTAVLTRQSYLGLRKPKSAMASAGTEKQAPAYGISSEALAIAERLTIEIPSVDWTIDVDIMGHHRITLHLKGGSIDVE